MSRYYYDLTFKQKLNKFKEEVKDKCRKFVNWAERNPQLAFFVISTGVGALGWGVRKICHLRSTKKVEMLKNNYCYDRSLGHYWKLRRELTNDEWVLIDKRKKSGERLADILDELKVLK